MVTFTQVSKYYTTALVLLASVCCQTSGAQGAAAAIAPAKAADSCKFKPGQTSITVTLQNNPNAFEPVCQPTRIRVNDRTPVKLTLENLSPIEICTPSTKASTPTTVTNPLESIINTVAGLKSFDFEQNINSNDFMQNMVTIDSYLGLQPRTPTVTPPPQRLPRNQQTPDQQALTLFNDIAGHVLETAQKITKKQTVWQGYYQTDSDAMVTYLFTDYRGVNYTQFDPDGTPALAAVRAHIATSSIAANGYTDAYPPNELDYAKLQMLIDQMKSLQSRLINNCTTSGKQCDQEILHATTHLVDQANAYMSIIQDNFKNLQAAQSTLATSFTALHKIEVDYKDRLVSGQIRIASGVLMQDFTLGADYSAMDTGTISCSSDTSPAVATTDAIYYSITFQNIPAFTVSAGLLTTFLQKNEYGVTQQLNNTTTPPSTTTVFAITDSARASVLPMAYVNYRIGRPTLKTWWGEPNNELIIANNVSMGIGINSNSGTNQVEFFAGDAVSFSRVFIHAGVHFGRTESLGGGYSLGPVPSGFTGTTAPINWSYHPAFSIGLSVRIAPF